MRNLSTALFATAWLAFGQSQPPSPTPATRGGAQQEKRDTKQQSSERGNQPANPRPAAVDQSAANTERAKIQQQGTPASPNPSSQPVVVNVKIPKSDFNWTDLLIAIFTGLLVYVGYLQWNTLKAHHDVMKASAQAAKSSADNLALQRKVMHRQAKSIDALRQQTQTAAEAATESSRIARQALEISQRAYVSIDSITLVAARETLVMDTAANISGAWIEIKFRNSGLTHAPQFRYELRATISEISMFTVPFVITSEPNSFNPGNTKVIKTLPLNDMFPGLPDPVLETAVKAGYIRINGNLHYRDVFGFGFIMEVAASAPDYIDEGRWEFEVISNTDSDAAT